MNSNWEISDLIKFLIVFEKKNAFESFKTEKLPNDNIYSIY